MILPKQCFEKVCATSTITFTPSAKVSSSVPAAEVTKQTSAPHTSTAPPVKNPPTTTTSSSSHLDESKAAYPKEGQDRNLSDKVNLSSEHSAEEHKKHLPTISSNKKLSINPNTTHQDHQPKEAHGPVITTSNNSSTTTNTNLDAFGNSSSAGAWVSLALKMSNRQSHRSRAAQDAGYGGGGGGEVESGWPTIKHLTPTRKNWRLRRHFCSLRLPSNKELNFYMPLLQNYL